MYRELLIQLKWLQNLAEIRQGDFNPFGPKEPTLVDANETPRFEFLGAIGLLLGIFGLLGFLIFKFAIFISTTFYRLSAPAAFFSLFGQSAQFIS